MSRGRRYTWVMRRWLSVGLKVVWLDRLKGSPVLSAIRRLSGLDAMRATHAVSVCKARVQGQHPWACLRGGARKSVFGVLQGVQGLCP